MQRSGEDEKATSRESHPRKPAAWLFSLFADVRPGEALHTVLLALNVFVLLFAYYLLKVLREPLMLRNPGDAEIKSYASGLMALLIVPAIVLYSRLSERVNRTRLLTTTTLFFASNLVIFFVCERAGLAIGKAFFVWTGIFNMFVVSQFWSFANDLHTPEQGKRLFAVVAIGSCSGAIVGSQYAKRFFEPEHPANLMLVSAGLLVLALGISLLVERRVRAYLPEAQKIEEPLEPTGAFELLMKDKYLALIAGLTLVYNGVNSIGEYVLDRVMLESALRSASEQEFVANFRGDFYSWVNAIALGLQLFAVSRILKVTAVRGALFVMPLISLFCYGSMGLSASLLVISSAKALENGLDYSVQSTTRHALFLVTSREAKYKAKVLIDTFFPRLGDSLAALTVFAGAQIFALSTKSFVAVNLVLIAAWFAFAWGIARRHKEKSVRV